MDKEVVVHTHNGTLISREKGQIWVSSNDVDEPRAYTERSQKEKNKHCVLAHTYMESRKMVPICREAMEAQT